MIANSQWKTLLFVLTFVAFNSGSQWSYHQGKSGQNGPTDWQGLCQSGLNQSPVDLDEEAVFDSGLEPVEFKNYHLNLHSVKMTNNGHTVKINIPDNVTHPAKIVIDETSESFKLVQIHFHWGDKSSHGSEHLLSGEAFPMEMHLVHHNIKYKNLASAASKSDGLAVLGVFFHIQRGDNEAWSDLLTSLEKLKGPHQTVESNLNGLPLESFVPSNPEDFYRYSGSLTTPGCFESVTWTVFSHSLPISESQMSFFRSLEDGQQQPLVNNFRPVQPLNERVLYASFETGPRYLATKYANNSHKNFVNTWKTNLEKKPKEVDHFFLLIMSIIIFFMQCGFAFMEAGAVRSKNTVNILIKNWLDMCIGALVYWALGFGFTFGESKGRFLGASYFFFANMPGHKLSKWFFQFVFAATAATLVSGSLAERCNFIAYIVYSIMITGFVYPIIAHWAWHPEGWLNINGFHDFAGSAVVHLTGAVCALVGCVLMGPRIGRFDKKGNPVPMPGHSVPLSALGGLILIFGFFACNGTKQGSISNPGDGEAIATAIVNTALGTSAAGICTLIFNKTGIVPGTGNNYSFLITMNGSLTGTVALCAGCNVYPAWAAVLVGALSGPLFLSSNWVLIRCKIDDPLDAIPVHGAGGIWGTLAVYLFKWGGLFHSGSSEAAIGLAWNVIGLIAIISWTFSWAFTMFFVLKKFDLLRVPAADEFKGMDLLKHGESAYPADAWVEQQYMKEDAFTAGDRLTPDGDIDGGNIAMTTSSSNGANQSKDGLPPNMRFSRAASYNNPHEMFPQASKLFSGMTAAAGNVTKLGRTSRASSMTVVNEAEDGTPEEKEKLHVIQELAGANDLVQVAVAISSNSMSSNSERNENTYI